MNTLKLRETDSRGSFVALGTGFSYTYTSQDHKLDISDALRDRLLLNIDFDDSVSKDPLLYVEKLEKTTQIKALMFSNNTTSNLSETFDHSMLVAILENAVGLARHSFDLTQENFSRFDGFFSKDFALKRLRIRKMSNLNPEGTFYIGKLKTQHEHSVSARACTLHKLLTILADKTLRELVTTEYGYHFQSSAYNLLTASSKLSTIARILDDRFLPEQRIRTKSEDKGFIKA